MYETLSFQGAPMDTDGKGSAWFDIPGSSYGTYFPALFASPFAFKTSEVFADSNPVFGSSINEGGPTTTDGTSSNIHSLDRPMPLHKMYLKEMMHGKGSSKTKFAPVFAKEQVLRNGIRDDVTVQRSDLTAMPEYEDKSFEEIRLEDYIISSILEMEKNENMKIPEPPLVNTKSQTQEPLSMNPADVLTQPPVLNTLLQNVASVISQENIATGEEPSESTLNEVTFSILQALLNNVKQRFDVSCLSAGARRNCAKLTLALAEFTEKTLENLTVIVLEDMLRNIKQRNVVNSIDTADKYTSTCLCSDKSPLRGNNARTEYTKEHDREKSTNPKKNDDKKTSSKYEEYTSDCQDSQTEHTELVCNERNHRYELANKTSKGYRKKAASVPATFGKTSSWVTRSARHSISGSGRSADRMNRHRGHHRKLSDEKCGYRDKTYDDTDHDEYVNRSNEWKRGNRDDTWVTITKAKNHRESLRRKKKNPKKVQIVVQDECRVCESLGRVSINDGNRKDYIAVKEKNVLSPYIKRVGTTAKERTDKEIEKQNQRPLESGGALSENADESVILRNEFELESYSDSSSI